MNITVTSEEALASLGFVQTEEEAPAEELTLEDAIKELGYGKVTVEDGVANIEWADADEKTKGEEALRARGFTIDEEETPEVA